MTKYKKEEKSVTLKQTRKNKMKKIISILIGSLTLVACKNEKSFEKPKTYMDSVSYSIGFNLGTSFRNDAIGKSDSMNIEALLSGIRAGIDSNGIFSKGQIDTIIGDFAYKVNDQQRKKVIQDHDDFIKKTKETEGVKMTESGLLYKIIKEGAGKKGDSNDTLVANVDGSLINGKPIMQSDPNQASRFTAVETGIPGLMEGLQMMSVGSVYEFYLPNHLAFGPQGAGSIPPYSPIVFKIDLMDVVSMPNQK